MSISLSNIVNVGRGLHRPECVLACADGNIYASDSKHGVARISPDGQVSYAGTLPPGNIQFVPNGIALSENGEFLISNIGDDGGLWRLADSGAIVPELSSVAGRAMPPVNFVMIDEQGRTWLSISTRHSPRHLAYRNDVADGYIAIIQGGVCQIVADGLAYTNEIRIDPIGDWLYVSETFGHRISRFRVGNDGSLTAQEIFATVEYDDFIDGIAFDEDGGLWAVCIVSNRVYRFDQNGHRDLVVSETVPTHSRTVMNALNAGTMDRSHFDAVPSKVLRNVTSIAFTGGDRTSAVLGGLCADSLVKFDASVRGIKPVHWNVVPKVQFKNDTAAGAS